MASLVLLGSCIALVGALTVELQWRASLGQGAEPYIEDLAGRLIIWFVVFTASALWAAANLNLTRRAVGSIRLPRRLGNLTIQEMISERSVRRAALGLSLVIGLALSVSARGGWDAWLLRAWTPPDPGIADPVLNRNIDYYLSALPWERFLHRVATLNVGVLFASCIVLYFAAGSLRWRAWRVKFTESARIHIGALSCLMAICLWWGYRLEPAEMIAGQQLVPFDLLITEIRMPVAQVLMGLAMAVAVASIGWMWVGRVALVVVPWVLLSLTSVVGHYVLPSITGGVGVPTSPWKLEREALQVASLGVTVVSAAPDMDPLVPVWDHFALALTLNRMTDDRSGRYFGTYPGFWRDTTGEAEPYFLAIRETDLPPPPRMGADSWERVHAGDLRFSRGAAVVSANRTDADGYPVRMDSLELSALLPDTVWFGPLEAEYVVLTDEMPGSVPVRGLLNRVGVAVRTGDLKLLSPWSASGRSWVGLRRSPVERLNALLPGIEFDEPRAIVGSETTVWVSYGFESTVGYPMASASRWRGNTVRSLRWVAVGVVDVETGHTEVFQVGSGYRIGRHGSGDVRPVADLDPRIREQLHFPEPLFERLVAYLSLRDRGEPASALPWLPAGAIDPTNATERTDWLASIEGIGPSLVSGSSYDLTPGGVAVLAGWVNPSSSLEIAEIRYPGAPALTSIRDSMIAGSGENVVSGKLRVYPSLGGPVAMVTEYSTSGSTRPPGLVGIRTWGSTAIDPGVGRELLEPAEGDLAGVRSLFRRLDEARARGDWVEFARLYQTLRELLEE